MEPLGKVITNVPRGSYFDWAAIFGGATVACAVGVLATGFGTALGLSAISAERGEGSPWLALTISAVWVILSITLSYAAGGYIAGRMRPRIDNSDQNEVQVRDGLNGLAVWAVGIILAAVVVGSAATKTASTIGSVAATGGQAVATIASGAVQGASSAVSAVAAKADPSNFLSGALLRPTSISSATSGAEAADAAQSILSNVVMTGEISDSDRAFLAQLTAARTGLSPEEANARVGEAIDAAQAARAETVRLAKEAEETARNAAETARISAILTTFLVTASALVAAAAAYVCAVRGGRHRDEGRIFGGFSYRF